MEWIVLGFLLTHLLFLLGVIAALIHALMSRGGRGKSANSREELDARGHGLLGVSNTLSSEGKSMLQRDSSLFQPKQQGSGFQWLLNSLNSIRVALAEGPRTPSKGRPTMLRFLAFCLLSGVLLAQGATNQLQVEVFGVDPNGERYYVPGAKVVVTPLVDSEATGKAAAASTESPSDANGKALFTIPDGCYQVVATSEGLKGQGENTCLSNAGTVVSLAIEMKLDVMKETLEVSAAQEGLETTESSASETIESSTIEHAPNVNERFEGLLQRRTQPTPWRPQP